ncbi:putative membrane protein [[Actinomadura] parvosata subsp. kistnae]|uniref:DUF3105 domain-containing protein n=2 Tax=Nonomuraea TaxID=83681 RepID=A0A1V0A4B5_9ACTN|nr:MULTISPECIES: DUF3105 domain-containing protein [unclassified Nonomuraea]AQZ65044.1 hypothetical protein BKM31_29550 [Nonomuraea sp. ATCC 55076]NJP90838.1 DUF3105 domain-containing protein [Nonomuraea sp. FMUSA5-5]SPL96299.1 putative membrane protein [Actinomadura parvosata subsp. kistnae]
MTKEKAQARREHLQKLRAEQKRKQRRAALLMWGTGGLIIVVLVGVVGFYLVNQARQTSLDAVTSVKYEAGQHVWKSVSYKETPPVGGEHNNYWQQCAIYDKPIHNEHAVHSLEHGAVWITYRPDLPKAQIDKLKEVASSTGQQDYMLMSPFPNLPSPIVISSWGHQLKLTDPADPKIGAFIKRYQNGPDTPEPGATCGGDDAITTTADQAPLPPEPTGQPQTPMETLAPSASPSQQQ